MTPNVLDTNDREKNLRIHFRLKSMKTAPLDSPRAVNTAMRKLIEMEAFIFSFLSLSFFLDNEKKGLMIYSRSVLEKMVSLRKGNRGRRRKRDKEKGERVIERERVRRKSDRERERER